MRTDAKAQRIHRVSCQDLVRNGDQQRGIEAGCGRLEITDAGVQALCNDWVTAAGGFAFALQGVAQFVDRLKKGETNLLWPGEVKWFAKSSGTTSTKSKFIPVTRESLEDCHYRGAKDILAIYTKNRPDSGIFTGKGLILGGSHRVNNFSNDSIYGDLSAILIENAPFWVDLIKTPKTKIALLDDFEEKLDRITKLTVDENVTNISGVPSWYLVLIKQILAYTGKKDLSEVWPNLEVFFHGGISFSPYREQFRNFIRGEKMQYMFNGSVINEFPDKDIL